MSSPDSIRRHWERGGLAGAVRAAVGQLATDGTVLTVEDLAPLDQFHGGGLGFTRQLATTAALSPGMHVLDVGGGLGGPGRVLAAEFGCRVTVLDLAESYVDAGRMLTSLLGLEHRVRLEVGDALALPFADATFDAVWTQNSGMNIVDKATLYSGFRRVLKPGGTLAMQEPMAGPVEPRVYPLMWAPDASTDHVRSPEWMRAVIEASGFSLHRWSQVTPTRPTPGSPKPPQTIQRLVMGDEEIHRIMHATRINEAEGRLTMVQAVFTASASPAA